MEALIGRVYSAQDNQHRFFPLNSSPRGFTIIHRRSKRDEIVVGKYRTTYIMRHGNSTDPQEGAEMGDAQAIQVEETVMEDIPLSALPTNQAGSSNGVGAARVEADPLPSKRGEIGYREPEHTDSSETTAPTSQPGLPARHPAEREPAGESNATPSTDAAASASGGDISSVRTRSSTKRLLARLRPVQCKGILVSSLATFVLQVLLFIATIAGWALLTNHVSSAVSVNPDAGPNGLNTTQIFIHVAFAIGALAQLVFLERSIYHMRAQRWAHVHGPDLPMHTGGRRTNAMAMGFAPWSRPPLPTYAAALAQSGVGTGDVEDNVIAVPPPPAYGHTRGSRLVLSGLLTDSMREQRARAKADVIARANAEGGSVRGSWASGETDSRPMSYVSRDEEWEERRDAMRSAALEETLARLEDSPAPARSS
ncbi:hypothetical protein BDW22DRAFT_1046279 [Trametopsis cervina]|nr:hypothetical protein BDW22DRAFT_1046279 [Trametopsis cervina]